MKKFLFISLLAISVLSQANTQTIGVGAYQKNTIYHSKNQVNMLPIINLEYNLCKNIPEDEVVKMRCNRINEINILFCYYILVFSICL